MIKDPLELDPSWDEVVVADNYYFAERSPTVGAIAAAMCKFAMECPPILKDKINPFFGTRDNPSFYADLDSVISATRPILAKHGVMVWQNVSTDLVRNVAKVKTVLIHTSGEYLASTCEMPAAKPGAQALGAAITYARRYGSQGPLNVTGEPDDDGNAASDARPTNHPDARREREQASTVRQSGMPTSQSSKEGPAPTSQGATKPATAIDLKNKVHFDTLAKVFDSHKIFGEPRNRMSAWAEGLTFQEFQEGVRTYVEKRERAGSAANQEEGEQGHG